MGDDPPLNTLERYPLQPWTAVGHAPMVQHAQRTHDVRNLVAVRPIGRNGRGEGKDRVDVDEHILTHVLRQPAAQWPGDGIRPYLARKVPVPNLLIPNWS